MGGAWGQTGACEAAQDALPSEHVAVFMEPSQQTPECSRAEVPRRGPEAGCRQDLLQVTRKTVRAAWCRPREPWPSPREDPRG